MKKDPVVIINGKKISVSPTRPLSFREVADFAEIRTQHPSVTMKQAGSEGRIVHPGESVIPVDGMVFNVADTSGA